MVAGSAHEPCQLPVPIALVAVVPTTAELVRRKPMIEALTIVAAFVLLIWVLWWQVHDPESWGPRRPAQEKSTFCAWCVYQDDDLCGNLKSPVARQECGPVCSGETICEAREALHASKM
jgi:hypothetical protein